MHRNKLFGFLVILAVMFVIAPCHAQTDPVDTSGDDEVDSDTSTCTTITNTIQAAANQEDMGPPSKCFNSAQAFRTMYASGGPTFGSCGKGVRLILQAQGFSVTPSPGQDWSVYLERTPGWTCAQGGSPDSAPVGAVISYWHSRCTASDPPGRSTSECKNSSLHPPNQRADGYCLTKPTAKNGFKPACSGDGDAYAGHVEIVAVDGSGKRMYISDHATPNPGSGRQRIVRAICTYHGDDANGNHC